MSGSRAEQQKLMRALRKAGFDVHRTGGGHWRVTNPDGRFTILGFSPRAGVSKDTMQLLKSIGYEK